MKHCTRRLLILALVCSATLPLLAHSRALAATSQEDPETVTPVFSGIALFQYYSYSLDAILLKDAAEAEDRLSKAPWANVPERLATATGDFASSGLSLTQLVTQVDQDMNQLKVLTEQSRLDEAAIVAEDIAGTLTTSRSDLTRLDRAVITTGREFGAADAPEGSDLKVSYQQVLDRIDRIRQMFSLFQQVLVSEVEALRPDQTLVSELAKQGIEIDVSDLPLGIPPERTEISLSVERLTAFVGERIAFQGRVTSAQGPLAKRDVDILLNSSSNVTVRTDDTGHYQGTFEVPFWYQPEIAVQALYFPRAADHGAYLASLSPVVRLQVQYYTAKLEVELDPKSYPGRETNLAVRFDYGQAPVPTSRDIEIYLDGRLIEHNTVAADDSILRIETDPRAAAGTRTLNVWKLRLDIDPNATEGTHTLTVSASATGRYAPCLAGASLEITRIVPQLDMRLPRFILIPGTLNLKGRVYSEFGPLDSAPVSLTMGSSEVSVASGPGGAVSAKMNLGMNLGIFGSQDLTVFVEPTEPWYAPLTITRPVLVVNAVNSAGIVVIFVILGIYLPARLRRRFGMPVPGKAQPLAEPLPPTPVGVASMGSTTGNSGTDGGPELQVTYWYRQAADLVARFAGTALKPQQTLREFAIDARRSLGSAVIYFMSLTWLLEKILYSRYRATAGDVEQSRLLSLAVKDRIKG